MLNISETVAKTFADREFQEFHKKVAKFLASKFPEYAEDKQALAATVDIGVIDGQQLGIVSSRGLAMYCLLVLLLGTGVKDEPYLRRILLTSGLNEEAKADAMGQWMKSIAGTLEGI